MHKVHSVDDREKFCRVFSVFGNNLKTLIGGRLLPSYKEKPASIADIAGLAEQLVPSDRLPAHKNAYRQHLSSKTSQCLKPFIDEVLQGIIGQNQNGEDIPHYFWRLNPEGEILKNASLFHLQQCYISGLPVVQMLSKREDCGDAMLMLDLIFSEAIERKQGMLCMSRLTEKKIRGYLRRFESLAS